MIVKQIRGWPGWQLMKMALRKRPLNVGVVDYGLQGSDGLPAEELGFAVRWRATPKGTRRAIRGLKVEGVVLQYPFDGAESAASAVANIQRASAGQRVWLALSAGPTVILVAVVGITQAGGKSDTRMETLTPRELEVLASIRGGSTNRAIGTSLGIAVSTVKRHVEHILAKLEAQNRAQAAALLRARPKRFPNRQTG